jgi:hypothetical protein
MAPLRLDARLFAPPPPRRAGQAGRPRKVGDRLPKLTSVLTDPTTAWESATVRWYDGTERVLELATGHGVVVSPRLRAVADSLGAVPRPRRQAPTAVLVLDRAGRHGVGDRRRIRPPLAAGDDLRGRPRPSRDRDPAAVVGPGDRARDPLRVRSVLAGLRSGRMAPPRRTDRDPDLVLVPEDARDVLRCAGGGSASWLGHAGYSDIRPRPVAPQGTVIGG